MMSAPLHSVGGNGQAGPTGPGRRAVPGQRHHILSVLVENKAGVLARVAGLFSRRGFNIYSLAVAPTDEDEHFSRITIVVDVESAPLEQVIMQLDKLINVVSIGAKVGRPDRTVWAIDGDGCFQMTAQELVTASSERIPIKVAILNNAYLGMVRQWQEMFYG